MCATLQAAPVVEFFRTPASDVFGPDVRTGCCTIGRDAYAVKAEELGTGMRVEFLKFNGGSSTVRASAAATVCTCAGWGFCKKAIKECRHTKAFEIIRDDLFAADAGDDRETVTDTDAAVQEYDAHYAGFDWE